jgi:uncharacterized protein (DUF433 family)
MESLKQEGIVSRNAGVMNGALVFAGTRVPVKVLMDHLAAGDSLDDFLEGFPGVSREQAVAYLEMAREAAEGGVRAGTPG